MPGTAPACVLRRRHDRIEADGRVEFFGTRGEREFLPARWTFRRTFVERKHGAGVLHKVAFITYFNAGVRAVDVRNPYQPREIGYFIPSITEATDKRCIKVDGVDRCKTAIQSNNVETDDRGYVYVVDRANTGMHVLELTGEARTIAGLP